MNSSFPFWKFLYGLKRLEEWGSYLLHEVHEMIESNAISKDNRILYMLEASGTIQLNFDYRKLQN